MEQLPLIILVGCAWGMVCDGLPAGVPKSAVAEHFEVLRACFRRGGRVPQAACKARSLDRHLPNPIDLRWRFNANEIQERRRHVARVSKLVAEIPTGGDCLRPTDNERIA